MGEPVPRSLTQLEAAALNFVLGAEFPGVAELREQAMTARVVGRCECGCPSIDLAVDRASSPAAPVAHTGVVAEARCNDPAVSHLLLWVEDGYLSSLEAAWIEGPPDTFPPPQAFEPPTPFRG